MNSAKAKRRLLLAIVAGALFGLADFIFSWNPIAAATYPRAPGRT